MLYFLYCCWHLLKLFKIIKCALDLFHFLNMVLSHLSHHQDVCCFEHLFNKQSQMKFIQINIWDMIPRCVSSQIYWGVTITYFIILYTVFYACMYIYILFNFTSNCLNWYLFLCWLNILSVLVTEQSVYLLRESKIFNLSHFSFWSYRLTSLWHTQYQQYQHWLE